MNGIRENQISESAQNVTQPIGIVKKCTKCLKIKAITNFYKMPRRRKLGTGSWCKSCLCKQAQMDRINNINKYRARDIAYRILNQESCRKIQRRSKFKIRNTPK